MFTDNLKVTGHLKVYKNDELVQDIPNLVVTTGKNFIASRMKDTGSPTQMTHMAIGTGAVAAAAGDSTLGAEAARVALSTAGGTVAGAVVTYAATFGAGTGTGAITEAGLFNAASSGTLLCRTVFSAVNKGASDSLSITWTVTIS